MHDNHKLQLAIYALLFGKEDVLIIFKGEKEMDCKNKDLKNGPFGCIGCKNTCIADDITDKDNKNLAFKFRSSFRHYDDGKWDTVAELDNRHTFIAETNGKSYLEGPITDRLHEFEKLGYEPEDLERILERRQEMNKWYRYSRDAFDALYYAFKTAGDIENSLCDDIRSMYPSTLLSPSGFINHYVKNEEFRKLVTKRIKRVMGKMTPLKDAIDEKIVEAITRPVDYQKVWVTTSSSIKDDDFIKKVKEAAEKIDWPKKNPWLDFKHQFTVTFNYQDTDAIRVEHEKVDWNKKAEELRKGIDEMHEVPADDGWLETAIKPTLTWRHFRDREIGKVTKIAQDKEGTKVTVTKNPDYQFKIKRVLFNNPATIVFWADGDKTVVKCQNNEPYDPEKGLAMAISKKALGNNRDYYHTFAKYCKHEASYVANLEDLMAAEEDNKTNRALATDAVNYLKKPVSNRYATKNDMIYAMNKAIECMNAILDNY